MDLLNLMMDLNTPIPDQPLLTGYGLGLVQFNPELFNGLTIYGDAGMLPVMPQGVFTWLITMSVWVLPITPKKGMPCKPSMICKRLILIIWKNNRHRFNQAVNIRLPYSTNLLILVKCTCRTTILYLRLNG
ncbi:MAG: hypothetical protein E4H13_14035 [Calditrichales bacterium]|nr:MAG: hypothetical protein E4H13_14035 [Calditrichales bacterium]